MHDPASATPPGAEPALSLSPDRSAVLVGGTEVVLTPAQFRLLAALCREPGRVFSRAELVEHALGGAAEQRTVDVHIKDLRGRLGAYGALVETVRGAGYRFRAGVPDEGLR